MEPWIGEEHGRSSSGASLVPIGIVLARQVRPIDKMARPLAGLNVIDKISFGGRLQLRGTESKASYKGPLFEALPGELIISKIRVGQGSFTLIAPEYDHVAVSPEYPVYAVNNERAVSRFISLTLRSERFMGALAGSAAGNTTKRRITPSQFESRLIPLPTLAEQQAMVSAHDAALAEAAVMGEKAARVEREGVEGFAAALGLVAPPPLPERPMFVARFADLDRWGHEAALRRTVGEAEAEAAYPIVRLGDVIADLENGWSPQCLNRPAGPDEAQPLVLAQRLRMHVEQPRSHADKVKVVLYRHRCAPQSCVDPNIGLDTMRVKDAPPSVLPWTYRLPTS